MRRIGGCGAFPDAVARGIAVGASGGDIWAKMKARREAIEGQPLAEKKSVIVLAIASEIPSTA